MLAYILSGVVGRKVSRLWRMARGKCGRGIVKICEGFERTLMRREMLH